MIRILHLCLFSFLISFCSGYRLETSIIVENEQYDWNKFGDLQIVSTVEMVNPLGSQLKPVLMYQILQSNDTSLNSARLLRFQVAQPSSSGFRVRDVYGALEPPWAEHFGNQIIATAASRLDQVFGICRTQKEVEIDNSYYAPIEFHVMKVNLKQFSVENIVSRNWTDTQREPQYNSTGQVIGWTEASNLTSTVPSSPYYSAVQLGRDDQTLFILVHSDHSTKLLVYDLATLTFGIKALISPFVLGAPKMQEPVGKLYVGQDNGTCYIIVRIDSLHKAAFENLHGVSLTFPDNGGAVSVLLAYSKTGHTLFTLQLSMEQCSSLDVYAMDIMESTIALIGNCVTPELGQLPGLQLLEFETFVAGESLRLRKKTSVIVQSDSTYIYSLKFFNPETLIAAGDIRKTSGAAFIALIDADSGDMLYSYQWEDNSYNLAHELADLPTKNPTEFYLVAQQMANQGLGIKSKAAVFQLKITNPNITTPWPVWGAVVGFSLGLILIFAVGKLCWQKRSAIRTESLLASHPKTRNYMKNIFNSFKRKKKKSAKKPLLADQRTETP